MRLKLILNGNGKKRKVLFLVDEDTNTNIADITYLIKRKYFPQSKGNVVLNLDGFYIGPQEKLTIVQENDTINAMLIPKTVSSDESSTEDDSESEDSSIGKKTPAAAVVSAKSPTSQNTKKPRAATGKPVPAIKPVKSVASKGGGVQSTVVGSVKQGKQTVPLSKLAVRAAPVSSSSEESSSEDEEVVKPKPLPSAAASPSCSKAKTQTKTNVQTRKPAVPTKKIESSSSGTTDSSTDSSDSEPEQKTAKKDVSKVTKQPTVAKKTVSTKKKVSSSSSGESTSESSSEEEAKPAKKSKIDFLITNSKEGKNPATSTPAIRDQSKQPTNNSQKPTSTTANTKAKNLARKDVYKNVSQFIVAKPCLSAEVSTINSVETDTSQHIPDSGYNETVIPGGNSSTVSITSNIEDDGGSISLIETGPANATANKSPARSTNRNTRRNQRRKQQKQLSRNNKKKNNGENGGEAYDNDHDARTTQVVDAGIQDMEKVPVGNSSDTFDVIKDSGTCLTSDKDNGTCLTSDNVNTDYTACTKLSEPPEIGSRIVYKVLEMSSTDYTPQISDYREACVCGNDGNGLLELQLSRQHLKNKPEEIKGRFEMPTDDEEDESGRRMAEQAGEEMVSVTWTELLEPRLLVT